MARKSTQLRSSSQPENSDRVDGQPSHRRVLRSTTYPARALPRFKKKAEQAQDERALDTLMRLLADVHSEVLTLDRLRSDSYARIDGPALAAEDARLRRRLQGIPETAPSSHV